MRDITSLQGESQVIEPPPHYRKHSRLQSLDEYETLYRRSIEFPDEFWREQANRCLVWMRPFSQVSQYDFAQVGKSAQSYVEYFRDGLLNISENCLDRHVAEGRGGKTALIWQGEKPDQTTSFSYSELLDSVCKFANGLRSLGIKRGDRVTIYMPMIPELPIAVLACARIGAIHSVVFSAFSAEALRSRIADSTSETVITADYGFHAGKKNQLKEKVDAACQECPWVQHVVVVEYDPSTSSGKFSGRDVSYRELVAAQSTQCEPEAMEAESPLFILYTSGSTGKPKGVLHTTAGYLLYAHLTCEYVFDLRPGDIHWCTADVGWITGHSYSVYGPLSVGATIVFYEGVPTYPTPTRFWEIIDQHQVNVFYTAPTAIRSLMRLGDEGPKKFDLSSLRLLGSVGEPINPEAWLWYYRTIGRERCPVVDTWWQTETGGIMLTTIPGIMPMQPGSAGRPFFGVSAKILLNDAREASINEGGSLVIDRPWPGMLRGVYGDPKAELIQKVYFSKFPGKYFSGDGCRLDERGYYWLLGRIDDVINVSAHRFATAELESALVAHQSVAEAAVVGFPHEIKGEGIYCYVTLKVGIDATEDLKKELIAHVRKEISPIATPDIIHFTPGLPKTRSGKIMRRILRKIAAGQTDELGDTSTLADPTVVGSLIETSPLRTGD